MASLLEPVYFGVLSNPRADTLLAVARERPTSTVAESFELAGLLGSRTQPASASTTADRWQALATIASHDLSAARVVEPHLDALAILSEAGSPSSSATDGAAQRRWGVFASEAGVDPLIATQTASDDPAGWSLRGTKSWCSLAGVLDSALVTATTTDGERRLFAVDLHDAGVTVIAGSWYARGLTEIESGPVQFFDVAAQPVGGPGWYLARPGFAWGGIGVAACWFGGAVALSRTLYIASSEPNADPFLLMHLGAVDALLEGARRALSEAAERVDAGLASGPDGRILALRVRSTVAVACEEIIRRIGHALGPAPLALDRTHSKRIADLEIYLRQHHAERDDASLGGALMRLGGMPW